MPAKGYSYKSSKTYGHEQGFSCAFRQWRAQSHCSFLHGYSLKFHFDFSASELDNNGWVMDFGDLRPVKQLLCDWFDHKTVVAADDPQISIFRELHVAKMVDLRVAPAVGIEAFARQVFDMAYSMIFHQTSARVRLDRVTVWEHDGNSASYGKVEH
jgi:6-pyruvoyltetrahydropterin/6-carboxytetrahydropterin synthase